MAEDNVYHERQKLQFCLLHALNNLFQEKDSFTRSNLDAVANKLSLDDPNSSKWQLPRVILKPHHNVFTGNYDVNVLIAALESRRKRVVWHDRRNPVAPSDLADENLMGIILNASVRRFGGLWRGRHWIALRSVGGVWYNLDSDLKEAMAFRSETGVRMLLDDASGDGGEVFLIFHDKP